MTPRRILSRVHLSADSVAGIVILTMSVTGILLAYERQVIRWVDRGYRSNPPVREAARMPMAGATVLVFTGLAMVSRRLLGLRKTGAEGSSPAGARQFPSAQPPVDDSVEQSVLADRLAGKKRPDEGEQPVGAEQSNGVGQAAGKVD